MIRIDGTDHEADHVVIELIHELAGERDQYKKALEQIRDRVYEHDENTWAMRVIAVEALKLTDDLK